MAGDAPRILLVGEDPTLATITAFRLELLGYQVRVIESGNEAVELLERDGADAVIVDTSLGDANPLEITSRIANSEVTSRIPVIAFSASADLDEVERAFHAGAKEYVVTPYDPAVLAQKLHRLLDASEATT